MQFCKRETNKTRLPQDPPIGALSQIKSGTMGILVWKEIQKKVRHVTGLWRPICVAVQG